MILHSEEGKFVFFRLGDTLDQIVKEIVELVLENNNGNIAAAARALGMNRTTLSERIRKNSHSSAIPKTKGAASKAVR